MGLLKGANLKPARDLLYPFEGYCHGLNNFLLAYMQEEEYEETTYIRALIIIVTALAPSPGQAFNSATHIYTLPNGYFLLSNLCPPFFLRVKIPPQKVWG